MHHGALCILREITTGVPNFENYDVCGVCAMGKYAKAPFPTRDSRGIGILDLIHLDVTGRMSHVSLSGFEYYVIFIAEYSRKTWIFFLKTKGKVFMQFKEFKVLVENQTSRKIKVLRLDNGGEYTSGDFVDFCTDEGIKREFTISYTP